MANTIFSGARFRLPYYATTGTDLTSVSQLTWTPSTTTLQINGGSMQVVRNSDVGLVFFNQHHSTPATSSFTMTRSRGTFTSQLPVQAGDYIGRFTFRANTAAGNTVTAVDISAVVDTGSVSAGSLNSKLVFTTRRGATEVTSLVITSETTSTSVSTGRVQIPQGGLGVDGAIYAGNIFTNGTRVSTFDGAYSSLSEKPTLFSGSYTDLTNKPTIPAAQVNSDWTASSGVAQILNKPTLFDGAYDSLTGKPTLFSGSYTDLTNKPTLFSGSYTDLTNKPTIPTNLDSLTDVIISSPSNGQVLKYNGTNWVNDSDATSGGTTFSDIIKTTRGNTTPDFDFTGNGTADLSDVTNGYLKFANYGGASSPPALTPYTWMEGSWAATTGSHGIIACVEGNAINALRKIVELPIRPTGDTMFIGNVNNSQESISGLFVSGEQVGIFGFDDDAGQSTKKQMSIVSTNDGSNAWNIEGDLVNVQGDLDVWGTFYPGPLGSSLRSSKGNLTVPFDFDGNGTVELVDSTNGYAKMITSSKATTGAPALTSFTWIEGTWATTTGSHAVISCVQGNSTNVLKKIVDLPPIQTGDTMFIGNLDQNQRAASGYYVHGEQVGMFAYDNNGGQDETTSTMSIRTTTDGSGRMELRASGGIRTFNTLTVSGGLIATGSTAYMQTKSYTDTAARDTAITGPVAGMIVLAGTTFYGYNGSAWVAFN